MAFVATKYRQKECTHSTLYSHSTYIAFITTIFQKCALSLILEPNLRL